MLLATKFIRYPMTKKKKIEKQKVALFFHGKKEQCTEITCCPVDVKRRRCHSRPREPLGNTSAPPSPPLSFCPSVGIENQLMGTNLGERGEGNLAMKATETWMKPSTNNGQAREKLTKPHFRPAKDDTKPVLQDPVLFSATIYLYKSIKMRTLLGGILIILSLFSPNFVVW